MPRPFQVHYTPAGRPVAMLLQLDELLEDLDRLVTTGLSIDDALRSMPIGRYIVAEPGAAMGIPPRPSSEMTMRTASSEPTRLEQAVRAREEVDEREGDADHHNGRPTIFHHPV